MFFTSKNELKRRVKIAEELVSNRIESDKQYLEILRILQDNGTMMLDDNKKMAVSIKATTREIMSIIDTIKMLANKIEALDARLDSLRARIDHLEADKEGKDELV